MHPHIVHGPRADALTTAFDAARSALDAPLDDDEVEAGWTDEVRGQLHDAVDRVDEAAADGDRAALLGEIPFELLDAVGPTQRLDAVLEPALVAANLDNAEAALDAIDELRRELEDRDGKDALVRGALADRLAPIRQRLAAGEYLDAAEVRAWVELLAEHGVRRVEGEMGGTAVLQRAPGTITDYPSGRLWQRVCLCDVALFGVVLADVGWPPTDGVTT